MGRGTHAPYGGCFIGCGGLRLKLMPREILIEISVLHVLCDHAEGVALHTHSQQTDDVGVPQSRHDPDLLQEVIPEKLEYELVSQHLTVCRYKTQNISTQCFVQYKYQIPTWHFCWHPLSGSSPPLR